MTHMILAATVHTPNLSKFFGPTDIIYLLLGIIGGFLIRSKVG